MDDLEGVIVVIAHMGDLEGVVVVILVSGVINEVILGVDRWLRQWDPGKEDRDLDSFMPLGIGCLMGLIPIVSTALCLGDLVCVIYRVVFRRR